MSEGNQPTVEITGLFKSFSGQEVLRGIDLSLAPGTVLSIIGRSGCGKSTLLRCMNGLIVPDQGEVLVLGQRIARGGRSLNELRRRVGMVFQSYNLFPHRRVIDNVAVGPHRILRMRRDAARDVAEAQLARVGLTQKANSWPSQLSGGQQQRVAIARSLAMGPDLLLLDEVTAALDPETVGDVLRVIRDLANGGMTMALVTHEMSFCYDVSDVVAYMDVGRIVEHGRPKDVLQSPKDDRTRTFLERTLSPGIRPGHASREKGGD